MKRSGQVMILAAISVIGVAAVWAAQAPAKKPSFDVISVKPDKAGGPPRRTGTEGSRFIAENVPLILLLQYAYRDSAPALLRQQVIGGPSWINTDRFDIEAKVEGNIHAIPTQQTWLMVQSLLEDRFKLRVHRETRDQAVYNLVVLKGGAKMKVSSDQSLPIYDDQAEAQSTRLFSLRGETSTTTSVSGETLVTGLAIPISPNLASRRPHALLPYSLLGILWGYSGRPVIDKTGLNSLYDFRLHFNPNPLSGNPDTSLNSSAGLSLTSAVEEQLGLKLEPGRGPVEVLVIDSVQQPLPN